jgi:hypothetical protein
LSVLTVLGEAKVKVDPKDNTIFIDDGFKNANGVPKHFREVAPMLFRDVDGQDKLAFVKDSSGAVILYIDYPFMVFQKIESTLDKTIVNYVILGFGLGVIALTLLLWPVAFALRRHYGKPLTLDPPARRIRWILRIICALNVLFFLGFVMAFSALEKPGGLGASGDFWLHLIQIIGVLAGIGALYALFAAVVSWGDKQQWIWYRIWNVLLGVACLGCFWFAFHWHLLHFTLKY